MRIVGTLIALLLLIHLPPAILSAQLASTAPLPECNVRDGLPNFPARARRGQTLRVAYLGGSITAQPGWRPKSLAWLQQHYPEARLTEINAAIGGTGSDLGVFRLSDDVLAHNPDLLFIEFAVNDGGAPPLQIERCIEGIIRQTWKRNPATDICFVYTLAGNMLQDLKSGKLPRSEVAMERVASHYGIPSINFGIEVARLEQAGKLVFKSPKPTNELGVAVFSPDAVHPFPETGHEVYLGAITRSFPQLETQSPAQPHRLAPPLRADNFEQAKMIKLDQAKLSSGWQKLSPTNSIAKSFRSQLPEIWKATQPGDSIEFRFRGVAAGMYDLLGPDCGEVDIWLDDRPQNSRARFDSFCTYHRLGSFMIASDLSNSLHSVKLAASWRQLDKAKILAERGEKIDDPKRLEDSNWYAGAILLIGDLE